MNGVVRFASKDQHSLEGIKMKKLLFCTGEGIGNVIQTVPVIRTLNEVLGFEIDFWHAFGSFPIPKVIPYVNKWIHAGEIMQINPNDYVGKVSTVWTVNRIHLGPVGGIKLLNNIVPLTMIRSEVDIYMDIARDLGVKEEDIIWHGSCNYSPSRDKYDVVVHNGYNPVGSANWQIKSYPHYPQVVELLKDSGLTVCSVGNKSEYIKSTIDRTEMPLLDTLGVIKNSKVFLGNDSGIYHCANALQVPNVVIFTATSIEKNHDKRFHKYSTVIGRDDLKCRPCQAGRRWNKDCKTWDCREIDPEIIYNSVRRLI